MIRVLFAGLFFLIAGFLFLQGRMNDRKGELPVFLRTDSIALSHQTEIDVSIESKYLPDSFQITMLKKDYSNLWAHLNHLYQTNDVEAGKEYYTENWFRQINLNHPGTIQPGISRHDTRHSLIIKNWSSDGLVCAAVDSNLVIEYQYPDRHTKSVTSKLALVLLYQGDHWRVDAMRVMTPTIP